MTKAPKKSLYERTLEADIRAGMYLGNANEAEERGDYALAEKLHAKSQFWHSRYITLSGQANHRGPRV